MNSLFAYTGNDDLLKSDALEADLQSWLGDLYGDPLACEIYYGQEMTLGRIAQSYQEISLFSSRKAIVLKEFDKASAAVQKGLGDLLSHPQAETGIFILAEKIDGRLQLKKWLKKSGQAREFKLPYSNKIPSWIVQRARQKWKRSIDNPTAQFLWEYVGDSTRELDLELAKLDAYLAPGQSITMEAIEKLLAPHREITLFELQKAFGLRQKGLAAKILLNLFEKGEHPIPIILRLFNHYHNLLKIKTLQETGLGPAQIASALKIHEFIFGKERYLEQAGKRSLAGFKKILSKLAEIEYHLKTGYYTYNFEIEMELAKVL